MTDDDVAMLRRLPELAGIDPEKFPPHTSLDSILKTDTRIMRYDAGDIVVREGDYGNSAFLILDGTCRVILAPGLPRSQLGRQETTRKGFFEALAQLWKNKRVPEVRNYAAAQSRDAKERDDNKGRTFLQDIPAILNEHKTAQLGRGLLFGELAALGRIPRTATVFAETEAVLLEIRWQGLREVRRYA